MGTQRALPLTVHVREPCRELPAELVKHKEGTFSIPKPISVYTSKHVQWYLSKEEREAFFKERPPPDLDVGLVPKIDKYMSEFLEKNFPKESETVHKDIYRQQSLPYYGHWPLHEWPTRGRPERWIRHSSASDRGAQSYPVHYLFGRECLRAYFPAEMGEDTRGNRPIMEQI